MTNNVSSLAISNSGIPNDSQVFQVHSIITNFELLPTLFASCGDILLVCGKGKQETNNYFLCSYEIPSAIMWSTSKQSLLKIIQLSMKTIKQMQTIPTMKLALLLGDGAISMFDIDSLNEICIVSNNVALFTTSYDIPSSISTLSTSVPLSTKSSISLSSSTSSSNIPVITPLIVRICVVRQNRQLRFFRCCFPQRYFEEENNLPDAFELFDIPQSIAVSHDKICIAYDKSYVIMNLLTGMIIHEISLTKKHSPLINCLQEQTQWCIQIDTHTVFLNSNFEPLYKDGIIWKDIPSMIIQVTPYILAVTNQSIDICLFNGTESIPMQQIPLNKSSKINKYFLWRDSQANRIYFGTSIDLHLLELLPVHTQIQKFIATYKYDIALSIIRSALNISNSSSNNNNQPRTIDGHAKGNLDISRMPKMTTFIYNKQGPTGLSSNFSNSPQKSMNHCSPSDPSWNTTLEIWYDYYRIGTMYAFQLFHEEKFQQAFVEFHEFLTDPAEIISLFPSLTTDIWLTSTHWSLTNFVKQHPYFSEPNDFTGIKLQKALHELQLYLTELRRIFQIIYRRLPDTWLEVQSLVQNGLILRSIRDLLTIIETALFKTYSILNNYSLISALLRNEDNCCLPWEVEKVLIKNNRCADLVLFYQRQGRHIEALQLITSTKSLAFTDRVLNYLSKVDNNHLTLVFQYVRPIIRSALQQNNGELLDDILALFINESTIKFEPIAVYNFLKDFNTDFTIRYLRSALSVLLTKPNAEQQVPGNGVDSAYWRQYLELSDKLNQLTQAKQGNHHHIQSNNVNQENNSAINQQPISHIHELPVQSQASHVPAKPTPCITVCQGSLSTQQVDVIVVCSSSHYLFDAVCRAGGNAIRVSFIAESKDKPDAPLIAVKAEGQIASKRIYFLPWKVHFDKVFLVKSVKIFVENAITRAAQEGYRSIAFPAIGCGQVGCSVTLVAQAMVQEAYQLVHKHGISVLFVIEPQRTDVYQEFQKEINLIQPSSVSIIPMKVVSLPVNKGAIEVEIGDLIAQKADAIVVSSSSLYLTNSILKAAGNQTEMAYNTERKSNSNAKLISTPAGVLPSKRVFFVKWQPDKDDNKLRQSLIDLVSTVMQNAMAYKLNSIAFPAIGCGQHSCSVDVIVKTLVNEIKHQLSIKNLHLTVKFVIHSDQQNIYNEFCKQVLAKQEDVSRLMNYQLPATWEKSQHNKIRFVLSNTSYEYKLIATNFDQSMRGNYNQIVQIERIQNERWYIQYIAHSHSFQARLNKNTERSLYHGCPESAVNLILEECFNRSFAGVNGTMYGVGVYFSSDPAYSHLYTKSNSRGERHMFLARVLIGNTIIGNSSMKTRPAGYDSTTDGKHIFVTFHDAQAYAEYLITYK